MTEEVRRTQLLNKVCQKLLERPIIQASGPHGIGKTVFLQQLRDHLGSQTNISVGLYALKSELEGCELYLKILAEIIPQWVPPRGDVKDTIKQFGEALEGMGPEFAKGACKDALDFITGWLGVNIKNTAEAFVKLCKKISKKGEVRFSLEQLLAENKQALINTYLQLLRSISKATRSGDRHVIILDQVERSSDTVRLFLFSLLLNLPDKFCLICGLNDEIPQGLEFLDAMHKKFIRTGYKLKMPGFTVQDVEDLIRQVHETHTTRPQIEIKEVLKNTDGRPLFIFPWVKLNFDMSLIKKRPEELVRSEEYDRVKQCYKVLLEKCGAAAQDVAKTLALLQEPLPGGLGDYACARGLNPTDCERYLNELAGNNILNDQYWFRHELIKNYIFDSTQPDVKRDLTAPLLKLLEERYSRELDPAGPLPLSPALTAYACLLPYSNDPKKCLEINLQLGRRKDDLGELKPALTFYNKALQAARAIPDRPGEGTTLNNIGAVYDNLGQPQEALKYCKDALAITREVGDRAGEAVTLSNIAVLQEKEDKIDEAIRLMEQVVEIDKQTQSPDLARHLAYLEGLRRKRRGGT